jgi:hypothetical protein
MEELNAWKQAERRKVEEKNKNKENLLNSQKTQPFFHL